MKYTILLMILMFAQCATVKKLTPKQILDEKQDYNGRKDTYAFIGEKLQLKPYDTICDIAGGFGYSSSLLANYVPPNTTFFEEDIIASCNAREFAKTFKFFDATANISNFRFAKGTEKTIPFKAKQFSTVTMFISLHEFAYKETMLLEISRIMRKDAQLCIVEQVYKNIPIKDPNCGFTYLQEQELYKLINHGRFSIKTDTTFYKDSDTSNGYTKVFICKKM